MAERVSGGSDLDEMFDDARVAEKAPQRQNLGNIPPELDPFPGPPVTQRAETPEQPQPSDAPPPEPEPVEEPTEESAPEPAPASDPHADRLAALEREILFLRAAPQPAPVPSVPQPEVPALPFVVTEEDAAIIAAGGPRAAQLMQGALVEVYRRARQDALQDAAQGYTVIRQTEGTAQNLRAMFQAQAPDLAAYPEIVNAAGTQVEAMYPNLPPNQKHLLLPEVARVARARLAQLGITPTQRPATQTAGTTKRAKVRPAALEGGGAIRRGGGNGRAANPIERDVLQMFDDAMGVTH